MPKKLFAPPYDILGELLAACRQHAGLTQEELAESLSMGQSAISKVERGVQRLDLVEIYRWLAATGGPTLSEFAAAFETRLHGQTAVERRWKGSKTKKRRVPGAREAGKPA